MNSTHLKKLEDKGIAFEKDSGLLRLTETATFTRSEGKLVSTRSKDSLELLEAKSSSKVTGPIYPVLRAMTGNKVTRNCTFYPLDELMGVEDIGTGVYSWLYPYARPIILDHNESGGMFGGDSSPALGRIKAAGVVDGENYLSLVPEINDPEAIQKILDGRYLTVSIGVSAESCKCSICGTDQRQEWCDHNKGETYSVKQKNGSIINELCYYIIGGIRAREISFVNVPSDDEAQVVVKDLGETGVKSWSKKKGVMSRTESVENKESQSDLQNALKGWWFVESKQKDNIKMANNKETVETTEVTTEETTTTPPAENTDSQQIELNSIADIIDEANALVAISEAGEEPDADRVARLQAAVSKAGVSENHKVRVVVGELEGIPSLDANTSFEDVNTEDSEESIKTLIEKVKNSDGQVDLTVNESLLLLEELNRGLSVKVTSLEESNTELSTKLASVEAKVVELESTDSGEAQVKLEEAMSQVDSISEAYKSLLVKFTAIESIRAKRAFTKNRSMDEVIEHLSSRNLGSIQDTLNDLLEENVTVSGVPSVEPVVNPVTASRTEGSGAAVVTDVAKLLKKLQKPKEEGTSESNVTSEEVAVTDGNGGMSVRVTEESDGDEIEVHIENGMMIFRPKQKSDEE